MTLPPFHINCAAAALLLISPAASLVAQTMAVENGDLLMGFYEISEDGASTGGNTYVLNLGPAGGWRETASVPALAANIKADLDAAFPGWADNARLRFGIVGTVADVTPAPLNGDPARTVYLSRGASSFQKGATESMTFSANQMGTASTQIKGFAGAMNGQQAGSNPKGSVISTSANLNFASFLPPASTTYFGVGINPLANFGPGDIGAAEGYRVEAAVDVYRLLFSTAGADLTAAHSAGDAAARSGQYIGTFTLDGAGNVRMDVPPAGSSGEGYEAWADSFNLAPPNRAADADPDKDGIANGLEFVLGGDPASQDNSSLVPVVSLNGEFVEFSFRRQKKSIVYGPVVEFSTALQSGWTEAVETMPGVSFSFVPVDEKTDMVKARIPAGSGQLFVRLSIAIQ